MSKVLIDRIRVTAVPMFQWDRGQELEIHGLSLAAAPEVHFAKAGVSTAQVTQGTMDDSGVVFAAIPDDMLEKAGDLLVWLVQESGRTSSTLCEILVPVLGRAKPSDYETEV